MNQTKTSLNPFVLCLASLITTALSPPTSHANAPAPNIILFLADDMGWTGTSVAMDPSIPESRSDFYQTPNLERLAAAGARFSRAYAPAPLCTPSRAAILTGITPAELHMTTPGGGRTRPFHRLAQPAITRELPTQLVSIPKALETCDYRSAHFGKWHVGQTSPGEYGFAAHDGPNGNEGPREPQGPKDMDGITEKALAFIEEQHSRGRPFYLHLSHYAVHTPIESRPSTFEQFDSRPPGSQHNRIDYGAMTHDLDSALGRILDQLDALKIRDQTYVVFYSDNGAQGNRRRPENHPLQAGKGTLYEGGIRVPLVIRGPDIQSGSVIDVPVTGIDLLPTFLAWARATNVPLLEGESLVPLLVHGPAPQWRDRPLLFHYPHYGQSPIQRPQSALILGDYKLLHDIESGESRLFNLEEDIGEIRDLATSNPEKHAELRALLEQRLKEVGAQSMSPNPRFDPSFTPRQPRFGQRRPR